MGLEDRVDRTLPNVRGLIQRVADAMGAGRGGVASASR